jgi:hypothetical protein
MRQKFTVVLTILTNGNPESVKDQHTEEGIRRLVIKAVGKTGAIPGLDMLNMEVIEENVKPKQ